MAWAMYLPSAGGAYGPYGTNEGPVDVYGDGWSHRLRRDYDILPAAQKALYRNAPMYSYCVTEKFLYESGHKQPGPDDVVVTPIEAHEPPRFFQTENGFSELSSIISLNNRMWAVDEAVKTMVERLEPGLHQFYPLEIRMPRGKTYSVPYHVLVTGKWLESFSPERSVPDAFKTYEGAGVKWFHIRGDKKSVTGLALRQSVFTDAHLWRERGLNEWLIFISDELQAKLASAALMLPKHYRVESI
jgi:hypothetical protein